MHILIEGESGTGKSMLARAIHAASVYADHPLVTVGARNRSSIHLRSKLFGHVKGAMPGAFENRRGVLQSCIGGTVILDDLDCLPPETQALLARAIATRQAFPFGSRRGYNFDVRLVGLSTRSLESLVELGSFNPALYDALSTTHIRLPALRDRPEDIDGISGHFLEKYHYEAGLHHLRLTEGALNLLRQHSWPGNIRELNQILLRAASNAIGPELTARDLRAAQSNDWSEGVHNRGVKAEAAAIRFLDENGKLRTLREVEAECIRFAVQHPQGSISEIAHALGISRSTLYRRLSELGLDSK